MFDFIAIVAAIAFILLALQLRAMLAMPFPRQSARLVAGDWSTLLAAEDVITQAREEWAALGFRGPQWLSIGSEPAEAALVRNVACFRREDDGMLAFLLPQFMPETPNRCVVYLATRLDDGRTLVSQPSDPFFLLTSSDAEPAQMLAPAALPDLVAAHAAFVAQHGAPAADATSDAVVADVAGSWMNRRRERLLAQGQIQVGSDGIARPRLGFALRAMRLFWSRPRWPENSAPIPAARLTLIAQTSTRIRERAPTAAMQWLLFVFSVALFMAVGAVVFGLAFALILLVVIAIHEAGHYFAMRAFGYRNVQMLALPLVGGVTVGHEAHPRATHRAWMALMGPLPGIVIGWVLVAVALASRDDGWLMQAAWVFLAINYLNVVPVPPLDGGHIVQAMLPARWYGLRIAFLVLACLLGAAASFAYGVVGLALIVLLQLGQVPGLLQNRRAIKHVLAQGGVPVDALRGRKLRVAFDALEQIEGPAMRARARIHQAEDIVRSLDVVPMSWPSRLLTGGVYGGLLLGPAAVLLGALMLGGNVIDGMPSAAELAAQEAWLDDLEARAASMSEAQLRNELGGLVDADADLDLRATWVALQFGQQAQREQEQRRADAFRALADSGLGKQLEQFPRPNWVQRLLLDMPAWPASASAAELAATERRIGRELPDELRKFYVVHNGFPLLQLGPLSDLRPVPEPAQTIADVASAQLDTPFSVVGYDGDRGIALRLSPGDLQSCVAISAALSADLAREVPWPELLWCPRLERAGVTLVNTSTHRAYSDFEVYLRDRAAEQMASLR